MAVQTANVYRCSVTLQSLINSGAGNASEEVPVIAQNADDALAIVQEYFGSDLVSTQGPSQIMFNALTSMTGSLGKGPSAHSAPSAAQPPEKISGAAKHANAAAPHK
jgi:hypothetical protein